MTALKLFDLVSIIIINEAYKLSNETTVYAILKQRCLMTKTIIEFVGCLFNYVILIICFVVLYNINDFENKWFKCIIINLNAKKIEYTSNIKLFS